MLTLPELLPGVWVPSDSRTGTRLGCRVIALLLDDEDMSVEAWLLVIDGAIEWRNRFEGRVVIDTGRGGVG